MTMRYMILALLFFITACGSSSAQQPPVPTGLTTAEVQALINQATAPLEAEIAFLQQRLDEVEPNTFIAGHPNPVQIHQFNPMYFTGPNCTGQAIVAAGGNTYTISSSAVRAGIALRYTLPGQVDESPETYGWIEPGSELVTVNYVSRLFGGGFCEDTGGVNGIAGYVAQQQTDPVAYEALTGVPAGGFLEGTRLSTYSATPSGGLMGADFYDMPTTTGFIMRFDLRTEPVDLR